MAVRLSPYFTNPGLPRLSDRPDPHQEIASGLARGLAAGVPRASSLFEQFGPDIPQEYLEQYGLSRPPADGGILNRIGRTVAGVPGAHQVLSLLNRPSQAILQTLYQTTSGGNPLEGLVGGLTGRGDRRTFLQALSGDEAYKSTGLLALADFAGTVALDPLTYVSLGTTTAARQGLRTLGKGGQTELQQAIARHGVQGAIERGVISGSDELSNILHRHITRNARGQMRPGIGDPDRIVGAQLRGLERAGGGGIRFAGQTIPGTQGLRGLSSPSARGGQTVSRLDPILDPLRRAFQPRASTAKALGQDVADELGMVQSRGLAAADQGIEQAHHSLRGLRRLEADEWKQVADLLQDPAGPAAAARTRTAVDPDVLRAAEGFQQAERQASSIAARHGIDLPPLADDIAKHSNETIGQVIERRVRHAYRTAAEATQLREMAGPNGLVDDIGRPLARSADEAEALGLTDTWKRATAGNAEVYLDPVIAKDWERFSQIMSSDDTIRRWDHFIEQLNLLWKGTATVLPVSPAYFTRNFVGNVILMIGAGFRDPSQLTRAFRIMRTMEKAADEAAGLAKLSPADRKMWREAKKHGVIDSGLYARELRSLGAEHRRFAPRADTPGRRAAGRVADTFGPEGSLIALGRDFNTRIETVSRLAYYMDASKRGMTYSDAAIDTKKALFDYSDVGLTAFERERISPWIAFYTWVRKNTARQAEFLAKRPGFLTGQVHAMNAISLAFEDLVENKTLPGGDLARGAVIAGTGILQLDTPLVSAAEVTAPLLELGNLRPGGDFDAGRLAHLATGQLSGIRGGALQGGFEAAIGRSSFTGQELRTPGERNEAIFRAMMPGATRTQRTAEQLGTLLTQGDWRALTALFGARATEIDDQRELFELLRRARLVQESVAGTPTMAELREAGLLAPLSRSQGPSLSPIIG